MTSFKTSFLVGLSMTKTAPTIEQRTIEPLETTSNWPHGKAVGFYSSDPSHPETTGQADCGAVSNFDAAAANVKLL